MSLVEQFIRTAKRHERKLAIVDRATGQRATYRDVLLRSLILSRKLRRYDRGLIGVMMPASAGAIYAVVAAVTSGRTPVMINYSTGAARNCEIAQRRLGFRTIVTTRALLEKVKCPVTDGMVFIEDLAAAVSALGKLSAFLSASLPADRICRLVHTGGAIGKILVQGDSIMSAYYDDFEATALRIRSGWCDTGDMGYRDEDGYLWHVGRLGRFLKVGGEMVSLGQVEDALQRALPEGIECGVVVVPDATRGARIIAAVTGKIDEKATTAELAAKLARIAVPRQFLVVPYLPRMSSGKADYRALTEMVRQAVPRAR